MELCLMVGSLSEALQQENCEFIDEIRDQFDLLRQCVARAGAGEYTEPTALPQTAWFSCRMFGYSGLHHLRRLAAYTALKQPVYEPSKELPEQDFTIGRYYAAVEDGHADDLPFQHLMLHSDAEGYYVPLDFPQVIDPGEHFKALGGGIGSSHRLLAECKTLAAVLELPEATGAMGAMDIEAEAIWNAARSPGQGILKWQRFGIESFTCLRLIRACERSIDSGSALVFC